VGEPVRPQRDWAAAAAVGVLGGALVVLGTTLADYREPRPASPTVTAPGPTATVTVEAPVPAATVTVTATPEPSATERASQSRTTLLAAPVGFAEWLASPVGQRISWRESRNRCDITNPSGKYRGKWQMDSAFWRTYGGLKYAPTPDRATCHEQDLVAFRGWQSRGWQPWGE
jgi:hypothetical protein